MAWAQGGADHGVRIVRAPFDGTPRTTLLSQAGSDSYALRARLAGSATRLAVDVIAGTRKGVHPSNGFAFHDVFAGPGGGMLTKREGDCPFYDIPLPSTIDLGGDKLVYHDCSTRSIDVTDLRSGTTVRIPGPDRGLRVAGHYLAWVAGEATTAHDSVVVYDLSRGAVAYTIPESKTHGIVQDLDLASDGTVVASTAVVGWASPKAPKLHRIFGRQAGVPYTLRLAGHRFAFESGHGFGVISRAEVGVSDLHGNVRIIARGARATAYERQFDFDGQRVAWYAYSCSGARIHVQSINSTIQKESLIRCPLRLRKPASVHDGRYVDLRFDCYGYAELGCTARHTLVTARIHGQPVVVAGGSKASRLPLTDSGKQLLEDHATVKVNIAATLRDIESGIQERRHGAAVIPGS